MDELIALIKDRGYIDVEKVRKAYSYAERLHEGQKRVSGEPYIIHPLAVAEIVLELQLDTDSICAAFLHDTIEDCSDKISLQEIRKEFGSDVAEIVDGITKLVHINFENKEEEQAENLRKMFLAMSKDLRVIFVKLADRLHNMRTLNFKKTEKQRSIALETMHVYAPLAHRLGIQRIKYELEDLSLKYLDPIGYDEVKMDIERRYGENKGFLESAQKTVEQNLKAYNIKFTLTGRVKSIFSIYKKMYSQAKSFDEIYDFYAMRIIVDNELDCYTALGTIHEAFKSIPQRFKDYISTPKPNMYRSLHTTVIGREGIPFEVQIRTWEMHTVAEFGLAAHWKYKTGESAKPDIDDKLYWIRTMLETEKNTDDPDELIKPLKIDLFEDEIFVFTPHSDIINLPVGATPIDFAYAIHSAVGNKMVGAKVNGNIVPIDSKLENGQIVEILNSSSSKGPSRDWLNIVKTSEARNKIRQFFKKEKRSENIVVGKLEVDRELKRYGRSFTEAQKQEVVKSVAARLGLNDADDLYNNIGYGGMSVSKVSLKLKDELDRVVNPQNPDAVAQSKLEKAPKASKLGSDSQSVILDSVDNCEVKYAKCCNPIPGDTIIGFITKGHGVSIHKYECENVRLGLNNPDQSGRWVVASWNERVTQSPQQKGGNYDAVISVFADYTQTILADITLALAEMNVAVSAITIRKNGDACIVEVAIKCSNIDHMRSIMQGLHKIKKIKDVVRGSVL
ncbi:MAG: bifunctional (p)ppGpp synthetase/guanosine-3',5'-bis(diphosphate) 3'-pyrophosphohydrolase [Clostridia bacterium]|nr:bifunctional (p)ppGpp synthetase/guanosine-3',5'-bis(diphosphate) 3'-pyrophosphohydrolase [Clostridia bacterium]